jgi:hypothetical protein
MSHPPQPEGERKDINTRAFIDWAKGEFRAQAATLRDVVDTLKTLTKEVGLIDVRTERLLEHREHVVTTGKLMSILGVSAAVVVGAAWGVMQVKQNEIAQDNRELRTELMETVAKAELKLDEAQKELWRHRREDEAAAKPTKGRR